MINPTPMDIGRRVIYRTRHGVETIGHITGITESHVLVLDDGDDHSRATMRCVLHWAAPVKHGPIEGRLERELKELTDR